MKKFKTKICSIIDKNKLKKVLPIILLLLLITLVIGLTYAAFTLTEVGNENVITSGLVSMSYTESTNIISIADALPISDVDGKTSENYFDFSVTSNLTLNENDPDTKVNYSIEVEPLLTTFGYSVNKNITKTQENECQAYYEDEMMWDTEEIGDLCSGGKDIGGNTLQDYADWANEEYNFEAIAYYMIPLEKIGIINTKRSWAVNSNLTEEQINSCTTWWLNEEGISSSDTYYDEEYENFYSLCSGGNEGGITLQAYIDSIAVPNDLVSSLNEIGIINNVSNDLDEGYNALSDNDIKIYLEDITNNKVLIDSKLISNLKGTILKSLYSTSHKHTSTINSVTTKYRLRAWIDYGVDATEWNETNKYEYKFRININGDVNAVGYSTPEYCFVTDGSTITDYNCYDGNSYGYETITDVIIPEKINGVDVTTIGQVAFYENNLTSVTIPNSVTTIGHAAFLGNNLTSVTIPNTVTTIGSQAFESNNLTSVDIPNSVTTIGDYAFDYDNFSNEKISQILEIRSCFEYTINNNEVTISDYNCRDIRKLIIPNIINGYTVTTIGYRAFYSNNLTSVTIPNSVTTIGEAAFWVGKLTSVTLGNSVTTIGDYAFSDNNLTSVTIPNSVTTIGDFAFWDNNLKSVTLGNSVTAIGDRAFKSNNLTSVKIPNSVTTIGDFAFSSNPNLTSIVVDPNNTVYDSRNNSNAIIETSTNTLIKGCKATVIPNTVTTIGDFAFYNEGLTEIIIPNSVTTIGIDAFYGNNLTSVTIPNSVTTIGIGAFSSNPNLTSIVVDPNNTVYDSRDNSNAIIVKTTNTLIQGCKTTVIPNTVTAIGNYAFSYNNLTSVTIPNSVTTIGDYAFSYNNLTSVTIPNSVTTIGDSAFYNNNLTNVTIPEGVTTIGYAAFSYNNLTSVTIPNSVTTIGDFAFYNNNLTSVKIKGKSSKSDFSYYGTNIWSWASGYSNSNIEWNYTE